MKKIFSRDNEQGQLLAMAIMVMLFMMIVVPSLVYWVTNQTKWSMKENRKTTAFNYAEAGIDRGMWKLESSTGSWATAFKNIAIAGYNINFIMAIAPVPIKNAITNT